MIDFRSRRARTIGVLVFAIALLSSLWFGVRTHGSFLLLRSAYELGAPTVGNVRGWMTLRYISNTFHVPADALTAKLKLPSTTNLDTSLKTLAEQVGVAPFDYVQSAQRAIAESVPNSGTRAGETNPTGWFGFSTDAILSALLVYGYPALAITLFLGAIGAPVPTGLATALGGSLAARGQLDWMAASVIAVGASTIGDVIGYGIGRWLGEGFLERHGKWLGLTPTRRARVQSLFDKWGGVTVLLTRTLVSHLSSVVSLLAGVAGYRFVGFIVLAVLGRIIWTSAYLGLGYGVGSDIEAASTFLANLTGLLLSLALLAASGVIAVRRMQYDAQPSS